MKKPTALALSLAFLLCACGDTGKAPETETSVPSSAETAAEETAEKKTEKAAETETEPETEPETETETEVTAEAGSAEPIPISGITDATVKSGSPDICDTDAIRKTRKDDMKKYAAPCRTGLTYDDNGEIVGVYEDSVKYAEKHYGFSFRDSDPAMSYVEYDFDLDGKNEYYLCLLDCIYTVDEEATAEDQAWDVELFGEKIVFTSYDIAAVVSVYYIDDDGSASFAAGRTWEIGSDVSTQNPDPINHVLIENGFCIRCGDNEYLEPQIVEYDGSVQLLWKYIVGYPNVTCSELFNGSDHICAELDPEGKDISDTLLWNGVGYFAKPEDGGPFGEAIPWDKE